MNRTFKYFREAIKLVWESAHGWTLANFSVSFLRSFLPLILIWLLKELIDGITGAVSAALQSSIANVIWLIVAVVILWFLDEASSDYGTYIRKKQSMKLEAFMYNLLHSKAVRLDLINFERPEYFDCLARASREAPWRPNSILNNVVSMFRGLISIILMAGVLVYLHWTIAVLLLLFNIPAIWLRIHYAGVLYNFQRKQTAEARKTAYFNWLLTGDRPSREIRLFGLGNYFISLFRESFHKTKDEEISIVKKRALIELISDLFKAGAVLITLLFIASRTINRTISLGQMAMFLLAFRQGMVYIRDLFSSLSGLYEDSLFIGDTFEFLNLEENIKAIFPVVVPGNLQKRISIDSLSFTYPGNKVKTIDNISFDINKGEIIAFVGPNGAGKSTLVRLICRLYDPDAGSIKYDGTDIKNMDPVLYRKFLSVIFQDFMLYNMNAGENIRLGNIDDTDPDDRIIAAASATGIHDLIRTLPDGYSTVIGNLFDDSRELSWGEWQKLALARALFRDAPVLIMDEPSSALDADTEFEIFSSLRSLIKDRTTILISHRFSNVSLADRIIVLDKGRIIEAGTHYELMKKGGIYYSMYTRQTSRFDK
jgi:ATP-binding cassette subfamily B protein